MFERDPVKTRFYNSKAWKDASRAYAESKCYICEVCKNKYADPTIKPFYKQFHVHHKIELTPENISNPEISLNADNFQLLCLHCHNKMHSTKDVLAPGLIFDENGMVRKI